MGKAERDRAIYLRYKQHETYAGIAKDVGLSQEWVRQICYRERKKELLPKEVKKRKTRKEETELFIFLVKKHPLVTASGKHSLIPMKSYNCLHREWSKSHINPDDYPSIEYLCSLSDEEILKFPHAGVGTLQFLQEMKNEFSKTCKLSALRADFAQEVQQEE